MACTVLLGGAHARAEEPREPEQPPSQARLEFLQQRLTQGQSSSTVWWYGWLAGYSAATVGQGVVYGVSRDPGVRANMLVGGVGSLLGVAATLFSRLPSISAGDKLEKLDGSTPEAAEKKLQLGESLLRQSADAEAFGRSWVAHGVGFLVAVGQGVVLWAGYGRPLDGAISFATSVVISEAQIFTQPTRAIDDRREYDRRFFGASGVATSPVTLAPLPGGAALTLRL
jgi:hypothetical protein